ncbi:MAG TPA: succinylglutamate desuccinylase/aspartoacylase family protein [Burkholderiaceae bacterium]|nr:succinylglutamate desuccinylase/aspartoacylase family protein [Burkholderiaceae bacterium]
MSPDVPTHLRVHQFAGLAPGPRLIALGAVHGNETCGTRAIERVLAELERGQWRVERGTLTLVPVANPLAYARGTRMGERNLNRRLQPTDTPQCFEDRVANVLCPLLAAHDVLLDLHSFRGSGEPFVMLGPRDNDGALEPFAHAAAEARFAAHLGPTRIVEGWLEAYAGGAARRRARGLGDDDPSYGVGTTEYLRRRGGYGVTLECGPHEDPAAPAVAWQALRQAVALLGLAELPLTPPAPAHEVLRLVGVVDREHEGDRFARAWASFDTVRAGETIGVRHDGTPVRAGCDGRIVFPDAGAAPGHEWFYLAVPSARRLAG